MKRIALLMASLILMAGCTAAPPTAATPPAQPPTQPAVPEHPVDLPTPVETAPPLTAIRFVDAQHGWAAGKGMILGTTDGGKSWYSQRRSDTTISHIAFVNASAGWALDGDALDYTTNGGRQWQAAPAFPAGMKAISFGTATRGWATDGTKLHVTGDGGQAWTGVTTPAPAQAICASGADTAWLGSSNTLYRTTDAGKTWTKRFTAPVQGTGWQPSIGCAGDGAWAMFRGGVASNQQAYVVYRTADAGATWKPMLKEGYFSSMYPEAGDVPMIDAYADSFHVNSGDVAQFLGSCAPCDNKVSLTRTRDGGKTWEHDTITGITAGGAMAISFVDADHGWVALTEGDHGTIITTADGGKTWQRQLPKGQP